MSTSADSEEEEEAPHDLSTSVIYSDQEQEQALLQKAEKEDVQEVLVPQKKRVQTRLSLKTFAVLILAACSLAIYFFFSNDINAFRVRLLNDSSVSLQRSNDYILDPAWIFDAAPTRREYHWTISDQTANPDGVYRPMILINKQFPGPLIEVNEGDTIVVQVDNQASNATTIHWHGIYQRRTNAMDGTVGVTQCPIAPGSSFTYEFTVSGQSGTYWYHAHMGVQTSDGLLGPLIIHSKDERSLQKLEYATDRVVMVQDYYHDLSSGLLMKYLEPDRENAEPVPDGALINGQNVRNCSALPNRICDASNAALPVFDLSPNENHRLRIINVGAFAEFQVQVDEHEFAVTEVDGTDVYPAYYHRLNINPAQRYSIIISANNTSLSSFWLRTTMVTACFAERNPNLIPEVRGIIRYQTPSTSSTSPPTTSQTIDEPISKDWTEQRDLQCHDLNTTALSPVLPIPAPPKPDASFYIRTNFEIGAHRLSRGFFNQSSFRPNLRSPILHRLLDDLSSSNHTSISTTSTPTDPPPVGINDASYNPSHELVIQSPSSSSPAAAVIDLILTNFDEGAHPLHLHGHKFFVLGAGPGYPPAHLLSLSSSTSNPAETPDDLDLDLSNPLRRDTATIQAFGWLHVRVVLDNPGAWLLHCHISWHFEAGMGMVFVVGTEEIERQLATVGEGGGGGGGWRAARERGREMCGLAGVERGGRPGDEIWDDA